MPRVRGRAAGQSGSAGPARARRRGHGPRRSRAASGRLGALASTAEGDARLRAELDELTRVKRPEIIARIRTAKEHGDLKENAEYHAAREEQSFLEGRVQAIEARLRSAVIVEAPAAGHGSDLGSTVTVDDDGETVVYTIVGSPTNWTRPRGRSRPVTGRAGPGRGRVLG